MTRQLFEVECWRERWFYKVGSRYTGPFDTRRAAISSAERDLGLPRWGGLRHGRVSSAPYRFHGAE